MIRVFPKPEPADFNDRVRQPGTLFLTSCPTPTQEQWKNHSYWTRSLDQLYHEYGGICAYCAHWIPLCTGNRTVEHYISRNERASLAYEWSNYRLVAGLLNGRKSARQTLDPFAIQDDWFVIDFPSLLVGPSPTLTDQLADEVRATIAILNLNDEEHCYPCRRTWLRSYCLAEIDEHFFSAKAPFTYRELVRQGLLTQICEMMGFD